MEKSGKAKVLLALSEGPKDFQELRSIVEDWWDLRAILSALRNDGMVQADRPLTGSRSWGALWKLRGAQ